MATRGTIVTLSCPACEESTLGFRIIRVPASWDEPGEDSCELVSQSCPCDLTDEQMDTLIEEAGRAYDQPD